MPRKRLNAGNYPNRSDLQGGAGQGAAPVAQQSAPRPQPARAATGLPYGQHQELVQAQRAVPLPQSAPTGGPPPAAAGGFDAALQAALAHMPPDLVPLTAPSQRPNEPTTTGLPLGAGPGPEILSMSRRPPKVSATYMSLYQQSVYAGNPDETLRELAEQAFARGQ